MNNRGQRSLIDDIDKKTSNVEKELKFDKSMMAVGIIIIILSSVALFLIVNEHPLLSLFLGLLIVLGLFLTYTMVKEYIRDYRKKQSLHDSESNA